MLFKNQNQYDKIIDEISKKYGVATYIIKGLIALESNFNPRAYRWEAHRNDASYGLTQIMYNTAVSMGYKSTLEKSFIPHIHKDFVKVGDNYRYIGELVGIFDPKTNIDWGIKYFKDKFKQYNNNLDDAIASYNMGIPRLAKDTTPIIIKIYGVPKPDWKYANQPYVDRVKDYISYFKLLAEGKKKEAELKEKEIRDKWHKKTIIETIKKPEVSIPSILIISGIILYLLSEK